MVELVDTRALGARAVRCGGSSPLPGTKVNTAFGRFLLWFWKKSSNRKRFDNRQLCDFTISSEMFNYDEVII
jgi:hypothetical protein